MRQDAHHRAQSTAGPKGITAHEIGVYVDTSRSTVSEFALCTVPFVVERALFHLTPLAGAQHPSASVRLALLGARALPGSDSLRVRLGVQPAARATPLLLGYMLDGRPLYGPFDPDSGLLVAGLDACGGKVDPVTGEYAYYATPTPPYTIACFGPDGRLVDAELPEELMALLDARGSPLVVVMGVPPEAEAPPVMCAVKGHGLRWFNAVGAAPVDYEPPRPAWADAAEGAPPPPWLISPQAAKGECVPFGEAGAGLQTICCGSMIKYYQAAAGRVAGFVQYEEKLKTWDHACGVICVAESGGAAAATDASGGEVLFPDRLFSVEGGIVCASRFATPEMKQALLRAATRD